MGLKLNSGKGTFIPLAGDETTAQEVRIGIPPLKGLPALSELDLYKFKQKGLDCLTDNELRTSSTATNGEMEAKVKIYQTDNRWYTKLTCHMLDSPNDYIQYTSSGQRGLEHVGSTLKACENFEKSKDWFIYLYKQQFEDRCGSLIGKRATWVKYSYPNILCAENYYSEIYDFPVEEFADLFGGTVGNLQYDERKAKSVCSKILDKNYSAKLTRDIEIFLEKQANEKFKRNHGTWFYPYDSLRKYFGAEVAGI